MNMERFNRGEYCWKTRFRGSPIRFATKISAQLLWDVSGSDTCVVIFVWESFFPETIDAMRLQHITVRGVSQPCLSYASMPMEKPKSAKVPVGCRVQGVGCGVQDVGCGVWNVGCGV